MAFDEVENLRIFQSAENLCDRIWVEVAKWDHFAKDTVGKQLVRSADSIGANIAEGYGRHHPKDVLNFIFIARGSGQEMKFWLRRAGTRRLLQEVVLNGLLEENDKLTRQMNAFIRAKRSQRQTK